MITKRIPVKNIKKLNDMYNRLVNNVYVTGRNSRCILSSQLYPPEVSVEDLKCGVKTVYYVP